MSEFEKSVEPHGPGIVGELDVWLKDDRNDTYAGGFYGFAGDLAQFELMNDYPGLRRHFRQKLHPKEVVAYLAGMEVHPEIMGRGIGSAMLKEWIELAKSRKVKTIYLHRSAGGGFDRDLERFYERAGFETLTCCAEDFFPVMRHTISR